MVPDGHVMRDLPVAALPQDVDRGDRESHVLAERDRVQALHVQGAVLAGERPNALRDAGTFWRASFRVAALTGLEGKTPPTTPFRLAVQFLFFSH